MPLNFIQANVRRKINLPKKLYTIYSLTHFDLWNSCDCFSFVKKILLYSPGVFNEFHSKIRKLHFAFQLATSNINSWLKCKWIFSKKYKSRNIFKFLIFWIFVENGAVKAENLTCGFQFRVSSLHKTSQTLHYIDLPFRNRLKIS